MSSQYNDFLIQYMKDEEAKQLAEQQNKNSEDMKKIQSQAGKANSSAKLAFEQTQTNRFMIEDLKKQVKRLKITSLIAILIAIISFALVITDELAQMAAALP